MAKVQNKAPLKYFLPNVKMYYPTGAEKDYFRILRAIVRKLKQLTDEQLERLKNALKQDATDSEIITQAIKQGLVDAGTVDAAKQALSLIHTGVNNTTKSNLSRAFKNTLGVDVYIRDPELLTKATAEWTAQQSQLTNSIVSTYTDKLATIISNAVQRGSQYKDVAEEVRALYGSTESRASFIAQNEIGNLNAISEKLRQEAAGIYAYEWSSSHDERVRATHAFYDGRYFYWHRSTVGEINGVPVYPSPKYHPGMDYRCRCVAIPVIDMSRVNISNVVPMGEVKPNPATAVDPVQYYGKIEYTGERKMVKRAVDIVFNRIKNNLFKVYVSNGANLKPRSLYNILKYQSESLQKLGITPKQSYPELRILTPEEMGKPVPALYNYDEDAIYIIDILGSPDKLEELLKRENVLKNKLYFFVHELYHWRDAMEYRHKHNGNISGYIEWIRAKAYKRLVALEKKGYNINEISNYASDMFWIGQYDETYTEYRTKNILRPKE